MSFAQMVSVRPISALEKEEMEEDTTIFYHLLCAFGTSQSSISFVWARTIAFLLPAKNLGYDVVCMPSCTIIFKELFHPLRHV